MVFGNAFEKQVPIAIFLSGGYPRKSSEIIDKSIRNRLKITKDKDLHKDANEQ